MTAITVTFTNPTTSTSYTFSQVKTVEWSTAYSTELLTNQITSAGNKVTTFNINGFVLIGGDPSDNVAAQQAIEAGLIAVGTGDLTYTGADTISTARFTGLDFKEYRGNPIAEFTATFETEAVNVHAHGIITVGGLTLTAGNGFDIPKVTDSIKAQGPDEHVNNLRSREISIDGRMVGTLAEVNASQNSFIAEIQDKDTVVVGLSAAAGGVSLTCRTISVSFGSPEGRGTDVSRSYSYKCKTHDRYNFEPYTLGETPITFGGNIEIDVVDTADSNIQTEFEGTTYAVLTEDLRVSGKKYFAGRGAYDTFVDLFRPFPVNSRFESSQTHNTLELTDINISGFKRDGNFIVGDGKRYSASVTLTYSWKKLNSQVHESIQVTRLGVLWNKLTTTSHNFTVDSFGSITQRSVSLTGQIFEAQLVVAKGLIGTAALLGDPQLPTLTDGYHITSLNINKTDVQNIIGVGVNKTYEITITASQLNTAAQASHFLTTIFQVGYGGGASVVFDRVTSRTKSVANRHTGNNIFKVTSITMTISGEVHHADDGVGAPVSPNAVIDVFKLLDSTLEKGLIDRVNAATYTAGEYLPDNYDFFLNNFTIGEWQPFVKEKDPGKGTRYWKQTVSLSATVVFDLAGGGSDDAPDIIDTKSETIDDETRKFTSLQVLGFGTVFKQIGVNPSTATTVVQRAYKDKTIFDQLGGKTDAIGGSPISLVPPSGWDFVATVNHELTKDGFETRGITNRWTQAYIAVTAKSEL